MPTLKANGFDLCYEVEGPADGTPVLLIMGLATQMVSWPPGFIAGLNAAGYRTIRFDNRDIGLSEKLDGVRAPNTLLHMLLSRIGITHLAPYRLTDMAKDTVGVLDALGIDRAHVVGLSMGGMIGQIVAADYPSQVRSFTAIMTSTNNPRLPMARKEVMRAMLRPVGKNASLDDAINRALHIWGLIGTQDTGEDPDALRQRVTEALTRSNYPQGAARQMSAIIGTGDLRRFTRRIKSPTMVLHGDADPLVDIACGKDVAANVPDAQFHPLPGMAHDLPTKYHDTLVAHLTAHFAAADA